MKRIVSIMLGVMLCVTCLFGCSNSNSDTKTQLQTLANDGDVSYFLKGDYQADLQNVSMRLHLKIGVPQKPLIKISRAKARQ